MNDVFTLPPLPIIEREVPLYMTLLIEVVEGYFKGSEFYGEAWEIIRYCVRNGRDMTPEEMEKIDELIDRGRDDLESMSDAGGGVCVDFTKGTGGQGRLYK
jgi:hypothetical protein